MSPVGPRIRSWWWDYVVVVAWLLILLAMFGGATALGWIDLSMLASRPGMGDVFVALVTVVSYLAYLVRTEVSAAHATWDKRRTGLTVRAAAGTPPMRRSVLIRNLVKVAPWQLGHMRFAVATGAVPAAAAYYVLCWGCCAPSQARPCCNGCMTSPPGRSCCRRVRVEDRDPAT